MPRKIAIVGRAGTSRFAPWHDTAWEIWGMPWISCPRVTRLYEIHTQACLDSDPKDDSAVWEPKAREQYAGIPVYCDKSRTHAFGADAREYPLEKVQAALPFSYLENTICYQLAHALYEGVGYGDEIGLFGIHMMGRGEFTWQRPCVTWLIGVAQGRGVNITVAPGSPLFMSGYEAGRYGVSLKERDVAAITGAFGS